METTGQTGCRRSCRVCKNLTCYSLQTLSNHVRERRITWCGRRLENLPRPHGNAPIVLGSTQAQLPSCARIDSSGRKHPLHAPSTPDPLTGTLYGGVLCCFATLLMRGLSRTCLTALRSFEVLSSSSRSVAFGWASCGPEAGCCAAVFASAISLSRLEFRTHTYIFDTNTRHGTPLSKGRKYEKEFAPKQSVHECRRGTGS